jgi:hypothetical protein
MSCNDGVALIQQDWIGETERLHAVRDLPNLPLAVRAGVVRIGLKS